VKEGIRWKTDKVDTVEVTAEGDAEEEGEVEAMEGGNVESDGQLHVGIASRRSGVARRRKRHRSNGGGSNAVGSNAMVTTMARGSW